MADAQYNKYLLGTLEVPGIVLGTGGLEINKTLFGSSLLYLHTLPIVDAQ